MPRFKQLPCCQRVRRRSNPFRLFLRRALQFRPRPIVNRFVWMVVSLGPNFNFSFDMTSKMGCWSRSGFSVNGRRCLGTVQSVTPDHFRLLGHQGPNDPPLLSENKIPDFSSRLEVLGRILDTQRLTVTIPPRKQQRRYVAACVGRHREGDSARVNDAMEGCTRGFEFAFRIYYHLLRISVYFLPGGSYFEGFDL